LNNMLTRLSLIAVLALVTSGCEVQTLYRMELSSLVVEEGHTVVQKEDFNLYLSISNSMDSPAITMIAAVDGLERTWDWEEFQDWSNEKRRSVFGDYYESRYPPLDVAFQTACPVQVESFDHRDAALEIDYGQWLHDVPATDSFYVAPKGLIVSVPLEGCKNSLEELQQETQLLLVSVADSHGNVSEPIEIEFRVGRVGTWLRIWGRSFEIG